MSFIRRLVLPTAIGTPLALWVMPVGFRGLSALMEFSVSDLRFIEWAFAFILTLLGISVIGLPAARYVGSRDWPAAMKVGLLLAVGVLGGGVVAVFYVLLLGILAALSGGDVDFTAVGEAFRVVPYGILPGTVVAATWVALNFDSLGSSAKRND